MTTVAQLKESVEGAVSFSNRKKGHENEHMKSRVRKALHGDKPLKNTDMKPDMKHTTYEAADSEEQKQREHDALVAQEKGELGKRGVGRFSKVRQWYGKVSLKQLKALAAKDVEKEDDKASQIQQ